MNNTVESGGLMPRSVAEMVSKYNYMMVELRDPRWFQGRFPNPLATVGEPD